MSICRFHDLSHSCASLLLSNGVPMKQIQEWLGHSDFSTTANIYAHLDYSSKLSSAQAMAASLSLGGCLLTLHRVQILCGAPAKKRGQMNQNSPVPSVWRSSRDLNPGAGRPAYEISSHASSTT